MFMYGINNRNRKIVSNEKLVSNEFYEGGRNAIKEYLLLYIIIFKH